MKDTGGHASSYKVFELSEKTLNWHADADINGNFIIGKHKGPIGLKIKLN